MTVATSKAIGITELLEDILAYLPPASLLKVQRVSKQWQAVIQRSDAMPRKLFFRVDAAERVMRVYPCTPAEKIGWFLETDNEAKRTIEFNPFFDHIFRHTSTSRWARLIDLSANATYVACESMYLTSPPIAKTFIHSIRTLSDLLLDGRWSDMTDGVGVRIGDVMTAIREAVQDLEGGDADEVTTTLVFDDEVKCLDYDHER